MSNSSPSPQYSKPQELPTTTHNVIHEPPHWHHHTMTPVISSTPAILPHASHHPRHTDGDPQSTLPYAIRPGTSTDLNAIHKIYTYYVLNSAATFLVHAPDIDFLKKGYEASISRNLPYLVAVSTQSKLSPAGTKNGSTSSEEETADSNGVSKSDQETSPQVSEEVEVILGYAHLTPFSEKAGYGPSAELTMYLHPSYLGFGIGSALTAALETKLRKTPAMVFEPGSEDQCTERFIDVIIVRTSDDVEKDFGGVRMNDGGEWPVWKAQREKNRLWYLRKGFEEVGIMKKVGEKFGQR